MENPSFLFPKTIKINEQSCEISGLPGTYCPPQQQAQVSDHIRLEVSPTPRAITQVPMESVGERLFHAVDKELNKPFRVQMFRA